jgi:two-component system response regulator HydG
MPKVLVVDDQRNMRMTLALLLRGQGFEVEEAVDGKEGAELGASGAYDVVLTDLRMGGIDGLGVLRAVKEKQAMTEVIIMTAYGTIESAVDAMRLGAFDYIQKPFTEQELLVKVERALEKPEARRPGAAPRERVPREVRFENIVGRSAGDPRRAGAHRARRPHRRHGAHHAARAAPAKSWWRRPSTPTRKRADKAVRPINCAAITETLLESELFGHARGSFTGAVSARKGLFEEADGGTFFFDEIGETSLAFQAKLLRAIQESEIRRVGENKAIQVDVRIIAATNQDLLGSDRREALPARPLLPPRRRAVHAPPAARAPRGHPAARRASSCRSYGKKMGVRARLGDRVIESLARHDFPGNVRELENLVEQAVALSAGGVIGLDDVIPEVPPSKRVARGGTLAEAVDAAERVAIEAALRESEGNREGAAEVLDVSATTLWRKMTRLGIQF